MSDSVFLKKNKINLNDYNYQKDIKNRRLMASFSNADLTVLEEIIFSSQKIPIQRLATQLHTSIDDLSTVLDRLIATGLFTINDNTILVDKEIRKYFEIQIQKFDKKFIPGINFLHSLLKKVPIHILPNWYPIPRNSNNIFDSLIEKYLFTPQLFQRYLSELTFTNEVLNSIIKDVFEASDYKLYSIDIRKKYNLSEETFEECLLYLEFNLVCCLSYEMIDGKWIEIITLFQEWKEYLIFLNNTQPKKIQQHATVIKTRPEPFSFIEDLSELLKFSNKTSLMIRLDHNEEWILSNHDFNTFINACSGFDTQSEEGLEFCKIYISRIIKKLCFLNLITIEHSQIVITTHTHEWLSIPLEQRALHTYKTTLSTYDFSQFPQVECSDRNIREIEKSISRLPDKEWVLVKDFVNTIIVPISENSRIYLKKTGRSWKYSLPEYSPEELSLIHQITYHWFFEAGFVETASFHGESCLRITSFGKRLFGQ